jgi:hypothetical protein
MNTISGPLPRRELHGTQSPESTLLGTLDSQGDSAGTIDRPFGLVKQVPGIPFNLSLHPPIFRQRLLRISTISAILRCMQRSGHGIWALSELVGII